MIRRPLIHPPLTRVRQRAARAHPVQILPLTGPLGAGAVLETGISRGEILGPLFGGGDEVGVPD